MTDPGARWRTGPALTRPNPWAGGAVGLAIVGATVAVLAPFPDVSRATPALVLVLAVVAAGLLGGGWAAVAVATVAAAAYNLAFVPPTGTLKVGAGEDWVALAVLLAVAVSVGLLVAGEAERRRAAQRREAEVRDLYSRLEAAVAERARLAEEAARVDVLENIDEQRAALLRSVSHDLRTPLATIRAVASDLRDGAEYDDATRTELLASVCDEAERLDRLVANLLSLSRIEAGALHPERQAVPFDELVADRVRRLARMFRQVRVDVNLPADGSLVDGDYSQLDQVVTNLLENAARHAPQGSTVRLDGRRAGAMLEVRVSDEGTGVAEWERERVFDPFRRGEGSSSSGVGLAICRAIVEAHGGRIWVERTSGGGATFAFTVPLREIGP